MGNAGFPHALRLATRLLAGLVMISLLSVVFAAKARAADPVIGAAGDIACSSTTVQTDRCHQKATSDLLVNAGLSAVLTLGDAQYQNGGLSDFMNYYDKSWGRVKSITYPSPGNHEYQTANASGYFDYFNGTGKSTGRAGDRGKGYYSFDIGTWHLISLNSNDQCTIVSCAAGSAQETWLKADLAAHPNYCTLAYWHHPSFNSGNGGNLSAIKPLLQDLYNADADVILGGHAHHYERFAPQNPSSALDSARGIRQFVVGTGGAFFTSIGTPKPNSQVRQNTTYGVLKMTLHPTSYDWQFVPEAGKTFTDSGSGSCHGTTLPADTTKPTAPTGLTATPGTGQVALGWQASSDNVGVTGYRVFRGTTQVGSVGGTTTTYTETGLAPGTYSYTVKAIDAAGNLSDASNTASATVADTTKPTAPANLTATAKGAFQVDLTWNASTDNVFVTGYEIYRDNSVIATVGAVTSYSDKSVLPALTYNYQVRALDAAGNRSDPSNTASATTSALDTQKPTAPQNLSATATTSSKVDLSWQASTDNVAVTGYRIYRDNTLIDSVGTVTSYADTNVLATHTYAYEVRAVDAAGNPSDPSNSSSVTVPDTDKPSAPGNLQATAKSPFEVDLSWNASTDNVAVTGYKIYRDGALIDSTGPSTSYADKSVTPNTYSYEVRAVDAADNLSDPSNTSTVTVNPLDTERPTAPQSLSATAPTSSKVDLTWQASSDNVGVTGYKVYRGTTEIASIGTTTSYSDTNVTASNTYSYTVKAVDAAGNLSDPSNTASATVPDTEKPTAPTGLAASAVEPTQVDLTWQASSDNVGVTGYKVYRGTTEIASIGTTTSYSDTNVTASNTYSYTVKAVDAAGNISDPSNTANATTPAAPAVLTLSPDADAQVQQASPTTNFATANLGTDFSTGTSNIESFLRFTVSGVPAGAVQSAKLRLHSTSDGTADGPAVYSTSSTWSETTVNWNTRPAATSTARDDKGSIPANTWVEYDVTPFVTGSGSFSFRLATNSTDGVYFSSREAASFQPQLIVTTGAPDTTRPTAPGNLSATAIGPNRIDLSWLSSTDNVAVTGYNVYRGGTLLAGLGVTTSYSDTSVAPSTSYGYEVRSLDAAGNISDPSNTASATTPSAPTVLTLSPDADAPVKQASPTTNFATDVLGADFSTSTSNIESFLRFTVSGMPAGKAVQSAKLRLHSTSDGTADGPAVYSSGTTWGETTINWNNRPAPTSSATDDKGAIPTNSWVEYDVTPFVTGNGTYGFRLATSSTDGVYFSPREAASFQPQLVLTLG